LPVRQKPDNQETSPSVLAKMRDFPYQGDPHLETRVLAEWREKKANIKMGKWRALAIAMSSLTALLVVALSIFPASPGYVAFAGETFVVRIELKEPERLEVARAKIELPEGVFFDIDDHAELRDEKVLTLTWPKGQALSSLPILLSSSDTGNKQIAVSFFDEEGKLLSKRVLKVRMKNKEEV
jgi:hypothetical protein